MVLLRGYNGGGAGFTFDENSGIFTNYQYDPEYVTSVELFARKEALEGRLGLTANVFYSEYKDMQLSYDLTPTDPTDVSFVVKNADRAESYGAEFGADWSIKVDPYFVANAQAGYRFSRARIYASVENLADSAKPIGVYSGATPDEDGADVLPPRTYWVGAELTFRVVDGCRNALIHREPLPERNGIHQWISMVPVTRASRAAGGVS